jgi:MFS family permease
MHSLPVRLEAVTSSSNPILRFPELRFLLGSSASAVLASRMLAVVIGYQIYERTKNPLALGILGLIEAIPAIALSLYGGHVADRNDRRLIVLLTRAVSVACAIAFALISRSSESWVLYGLFGIIFVAGLARGFADPAQNAFESQVIPAEVMVTATAWLSSAGQASAIIGPALGGFAYAWFGASNTYGVIACLFALSMLCDFQIKPKPIPVPEGSEDVWQSILEGVRFVFSNQILVGSMALDLFAVLFGGAIALLPIFASDILKVGPEGFGFLNAAPSIGTLAIMLWSTRHPPLEGAGRKLLWAVAGFGVAIIVFGLSNNFWLSMLALIIAGATDGVSMVIRSAILRLESPEHMRGRIAAVSWIFIGSSNEIGAFESGVAASIFGTARSVWLGGIVTLAVVAFTAAKAPKLRNLNLEQAGLK